MQNLSFIATTKEGAKIQYYTIATYETEDKKKNVIIYTDNTLDEFGKLKIYCSLYKIVSNKIQLIEITTSRDKKIALDLIKEIILDN